MAEETRYGMPTEAQLALINQLTKKPFTAEELFVFPLKMIGDGLIPDRYVKMHKSLLEEYVKNANNGDVPYMLNHEWTNLFNSPKGVMTKGRVFASELRESHDLPDETVAQYGWVYIPRDRVKDGVSTNEIIESIEDGSLRDHSVGVGWTTSECSICGRDMWRDAKCEHYPGREYDGKLAYVIAKPPGDEFEVSGVFAGAYPTAEVMSQGGESAQTATMEEVNDLAVLKGMAPNTKVFALFSKDNVRIMVPKGALSQKAASFSVAPTLDKEGGEKLDTENKDTLTVEEPQDTPVTPQETAAEEFATVESTWLSIERKAVVEALGKEMDADAILRLAKEGQALKADLLEDVLTWGVRADGNAFARDTFAAMLTAATVDQLKEFRESFKTRAKEALKPGRETVPMEKKSTKTDTVPNDAYKV